MNKKNQRIISNISDNNKHFPFTRFFISNSILGVKGQNLLRSYLAIPKGIKATICKINSFSITTSICPKYHVHN